MGKHQIKTIKQQMMEWLWFPAYTTKQDHRATASDSKSTETLLKHYCESKDVKQ